MRRVKPKILIVYKRSPLLAAGTSIAAANDRFRKNHACHYASLRKVRAVLKSMGLLFDQHLRGTSAGHDRADIIITVGGDGTFFDAACRATGKQLILGVNSDPSWSVGQFCAADAGSFEVVFKQTLRAPRFKKIFKLQAAFLEKGFCQVVECYNDILICHANPAAMSRYTLKIKGASEEQRSSGIWISTAAGSTGAILSAGGIRLPLESRDIQYLPRELYRGKGAAYQLKGGLLKPGNPVYITSQMQHGRVFLDGEHIKYPLTFGKTLRVQTSPHFIRMIYA